MIYPKKYSLISYIRLKTLTNTNPYPHKELCHKGSFVPSTCSTVWTIYNVRKIFLTGLCHWEPTWRFNSPLEIHLNFIKGLFPLYVYRLFYPTKNTRGKKFLWKDKRTVFLILRFFCHQYFSFRLWSIFTRNPRRDLTGSITGYDWTMLFKSFSQSFFSLILCRKILELGVAYWSQINS